MSKPVNHQLRNEVLRQAFILFQEKGFRQTTTREIAEKSGMKRGLLHHYFARKADILFTHYSDFLDCIYNFMESRFRVDDGNQLLVLMNTLYYRIIFLREDIVNIFRDILADRDLTRMKIEKTAEISAYIIRTRNQVPDMKEILVSEMIAIGAEVELVFGMLEGRLDWTPDELNDQIIRLSYINVKDVEYVDSLIANARDMLTDVSLKDFSKAMDEHCSWYTPFE